MLHSVVTEVACVAVGTNRGEADGFALDILSKLKDVKSKVSVIVRHVVRLTCRNVPLLLKWVTLICAV